MATKSISWNTGGGNITLTYQGQGDDTISVQSDANNGSARIQTITIQTTKGGLVTKNVTISQAACPIPIGTVLNYSYTGTVQEVTLPSGKYKLQVWGAQGGSVSGSYTATGAKGGYSEGVVTLSSTTKVYVFVGGQGSSASTSTSGGVQNGGWNGGGGAPRVCSYSSGDTDGISYPRPGGGATDISTVTSDMSYSSYRNNRSAASLNARLIVAGGGAGASARYTSAPVSESVYGSVKNGYFIGTVSELTPLSEYDSIDNTFFGNNGAMISNQYFKVVKYRVTPGVKYYFSATYGVNANPWSVGWWDSSGTWISMGPYLTHADRVDVIEDYPVTAPSNAAYMYLNVHKQYPSYACKYYMFYGYGECSSSSFKYYTYSVTPGQTYHVQVPPVNNADSTYPPIQFGDAVSGGLIPNIYWYSWSTPYDGFDGDITIPSGKYYMYITVDSDDSSPSVTYTYTSTTSDASDGSQVGGGTSGGGTNPGTQSGGGGELGKGANMTVTNYRYASGGGGGGYYGGGASYDDSTTDKINQSGGGSGYVGSLENAQTKAGNTSFPSTSGGNETGHAGNGYARITRIS